MRTKQIDYAPTKDGVRQMIHLGRQGYIYRETYVMPGDIDKLNQASRALQCGGWCTATSRWTRSNHGRKPLTFVALMAMPKPPMKK